MERLRTDLHAREKTDEASKMRGVIEDLAIFPEAGVKEERAQTVG